MFSHSLGRCRPAKITGGISNASILPSKTIPGELLGLSANNKAKPTAAPT
jgi:hypothetical protein